MPKRNEALAGVNEVYYVKNKETEKWYRVFSTEQMREMIEAGRITDEHHVGKMASREGLGGSR